MRTKIIVTVGPASNSEEKLIALIKAGVNVFRINSSHGNKEQDKKNIELIRKVSKNLKQNISILIDLQGPKIRVGMLKEPIELKNGEEYSIKPGKEMEDPSIIPLDYAGIVNDVKKDSRILLDDGKLELKITGVFKEHVTAKVIHGGMLSSRKGLNIPGSTASLSAVTDKDVDYIKFAVEQDVDYLALSFVRKKDDIIQARNYVRQFNGDIPIIAKIEKPEAITNLKSIIAASDGVMVARGDLGIEISPEYVPIVQKQIINEANAQRKDVITATQMLESMIVQPIPTRAEASDVANAIMDGTDAVMLSGETAVGNFPVEAVSMMNSIARNVESSNLYKNNQHFLKAKELYEIDSQAIATAVIRMLTELEINAIVAFTRSGFTARLLSKAKPSVPIIAICSDERVCRRLNLSWGVFPHLVDYEMNFSEELLKNIDKMLLKETFLNAGDKIIITGGLPYLTIGKTNFLRLHQVGSTKTMC